MTAVAGEPLVGIEYRFFYPPSARASEYSRRLADTARFSAGRMERRVPKKILCLPSLTGDTRRTPLSLLPPNPNLRGNGAAVTWSGELDGGFPNSGVLILACRRWHKN
jgi:hypothetical protein